jgi:hypothetical protein
MSRFSAKPEAVEAIAKQIDAVALEAAKAAGLTGTWLPMLILTQEDGPHAVLIVGPDKPSVMLLHALAAEQAHEERDLIKRYIAAVKYTLAETFCDADAAYVVAGNPKGLPVVLEFGAQDLTQSAAMFRKAAEMVEERAKANEAAKKAAN